MVNYRCIGKGVTDNNGVAHMTYSSSDNGVTFTQLANNGYLGTGKGKVDVVASFDNPLNENSIVSEIEFLDVVKIYSVIVDYYQSSSADLSLTDGVFSKTTGNVMPLNPADSTRYFTTPMTFEFDVVNTDTLVAQIGESSNVFNQRLSSMEATNGSHIKIVYTGTEVIPYVDGVEKTSYEVSFTHTTNYYFNLYQSGSWTNFIIY